jgi:prepilin-type processing-associated H-X9-DG protein
MVVLFMMVLVLVPEIWRPRRSAGINCVNNLKQVGISFKVWALDVNDRYPMQVSTNEGGTRELAAGTNAFVHFMVMSNELNVPRILVCPLDRKRRYATNFWSDFDDSKLSYFVGLEATPTNTAMLLCGDRNLTDASAPGQKRMKLTASTPAGWTRDLHGHQGNTCFADGSVQSLTTPQLRQALQKMGTATNCLVIP